MFVLLVACQDEPESPADTGTPVDTAPPGVTDTQTVPDDDTGDVPSGGPVAPRPVGDVAGWTSFAFPTVPWSPAANDLAITDHGALCLSGSSWFAGYGTTNVDGPAMLHRVDAAGLHDEAFAEAGLFQMNGTMSSTAVAAGPADSCYLGVGLDGGYYGTEAAAVVRIDPEGVPDEIFAMLRLDHAVGAEMILDLAPLADGGVMVLGATSSAAYVARLTPNGALEPGWGDAGLRLLPPAVTPNLALGREYDAWGQLVMNADGSVLAGFDHPAQIVKLDPTGAVDAGYGTAVSTETFRVDAMAVDTDGSVVLAGVRFDGARNVPMLEGLDPVGQASIAPVSVQYEPSNAYFELNSVAFDDQSRLLIAGGGNLPVLLRLGTDGVLDGSFGVDGAVTYPPSNGNRAAFLAVAIAGNGTVVAIGEQLAIEEVIGVAVP